MYQVHFLADKLHTQKKKVCYIFLQCRNHCFVQKIFKYAIAGEKQHFEVHFPVFFGHHQQQTKHRSIILFIKSVS